MDILLDSDFEYLRHRIKSKLSTYGYPTLEGGGFLHHAIIGQPILRKIEVVDHINCNKLDNRRANLRIVSRRLNVLSTSTTWSKLSDKLGRGYYYCPKSKMYTLHSEFCPPFSHKDELTVARMFEYYACLEDVHYPCKFEKLTKQDVVNLQKNRKTRSEPGERVLVTPEDAVQADGKQRYRFDYFLDGAKTRSRAKFLSRTECRVHAYSLLKLTKSQKIVYNWN